ncbi:alpha/beta hydrolase [Escherichia coli]
MSQANLSETLFKPRFKHPETSTLVRGFNPAQQHLIQSALSGDHVDHWYSLINRLMWIWRGDAAGNPRRAGAHRHERCRAHRPGVLRYGRWLSRRQLDL